jgi:hypothetical protein
VLGCHEVVEGPADRACVLATHLEALLDDGEQLLADLLDSGLGWPMDVDDSEWFVSRAC